MVMRINSFIIKGVLSYITTNSFNPFPREHVGNSKGDLCTDFSRRLAFPSQLIRFET